MTFRSCVIRFRRFQRTYSRPLVMMGPRSFEISGTDYSVTPHRIPEACMVRRFFLLIAARNSLLCRRFIARCRFTQTGRWVGMTQTRLPRSNRDFRVRIAGIIPKYARWFHHYNHAHLNFIRLYFVE
jgi:hypothetical protein